MMALGDATVAQLYRLVELMHPGRVVDVTIRIGTSNVSRSSDSVESKWEAMLVCLFTPVWQKFLCVVLTVCTLPMNVRTPLPTARRYNERVLRWNSIVRNLTSRNAGRVILMDLEHVLKALDQVRFTTY